MESVTPQGLVNAALERSDVEFRRLLEKLPAAAYTCDAEGLITYFNQRAVELWGREPKLNDLIDRFCGSFRLFSPDGSPISHECCWMALALQENQEYNGHEIVVERPNGSRCTVLAHANPIHDDSGRVIGAVNVLVDISDRKRAEDILRNADRRKDEFLAILAHELRNPLAPLRTGLELMKMATEDPAALEEIRGTLEQQVQQMVRLVDDLLDVSRITQGKVHLRKCRVELESVVRTAVESTRPLIEKSGLELTVAFPPQTIVLEADPARLSQVFSNLLNNAAKYTKPGGRIWLTAERQGSDVVVTVKDTGIGIPADKLQTIFDMFTQVDSSLEQSHSGLGIGLTLVKRLVEMHEGSIEAGSGGPGRGSEFIVRLPIPMPQTDQPQPGSDERLAEGGGLRILVVDDNHAAAKMLGMMLKASGNEVRTTCDSLEALDLAKELRPDVVLLDVGMPKLNGYDAARRIREQDWGGEMVLIAVTGWGQEEDRRRSREAGFDHHLVKPVDHASLTKLLAEVQPASA